MRGNVNEARGPILSLRSGGSRETYVMTSVWFDKTLRWYLKRHGD